MSKIDYSITSVESFNPGEYEILMKIGNSEYQIIVPEKVVYGHPVPPDVSFTVMNVYGTMRTINV